ncbi:hypothetical protein Goari_020347 [Gossypium aridum]|uniref:RNase H type-1 domain-containing protein n=1 Tax=Gossypium aridum TaxID=34290 RepID=A0A7J8YRI5_GOSAI|nr:hypothetical protein [Gossypium aridum]
MTKYRWQFRNYGWVKVNVDGSVSTFKSRAAIARALLEGLKFAWAKGYRRVEIESDNSVLVAIIQNGLGANNNYNEIRLIQE